MSLRGIIFEKTAPNAALLLVRIGIGFMFMLHGVPKLLAGPELWQTLGGQMGLVGIHFAPVFWGFMAASAEGIGGLLLLLGLFTRPAAFLMAFTMMMATLTHFSKGDDINIASHAIELGIVFIGFLIAGAGRFSLDALIFGGKKKSVADSSALSKES